MGTDDLSHGYWVCSWVLMIFFMGTRSTEEGGMGQLANWSYFNVELCWHGCLWLFRNMTQKVLGSFSEVSHDSTKPMKMTIELGNTEKNC